MELPYVVSLNELLAFIEGNKRDAVEFLLSLAIVTSFSALVIAALFSKAILTASSTLNVCAFTKQNSNISNTFIFIYSLVTL